MDEMVKKYDIKKLMSRDLKSAHNPDYHKKAH